MNEQTKKLFGYTKVPVPEGHIKLSPSGLGEFRRNPKGWYDKTILNISDFTANKSSIQGSLLHAICEAHFREMTDAKYWELANDYLKSEVNRGTITEKEADDIRDFVKGFKPVLENWLTNEDSMKVVEVESVVDYQIKRAKNQTVDFHIAGSTDALIYCHKTGKYGIRDYKSSKRKISSLNNYREQLLCYALAVSKTTKYKIEFIEVVALVWNKTNGYTITSIREDIEQDSYKGLTKLIREIIRTYEASIKHPELKELLYREGVGYFGEKLS